MALVVPILAALAALFSLPGPPGAAAPPGEPGLSPAARRLQAYVQIDTSNPPGNEKAGALFLKNFLDEAGIASEIYEARPGRASSPTSALPSPKTGSSAHTASGPTASRRFASTITTWPGFTVRTNGSASTGSTKGSRR